MLWRYGQEQGIATLIGRDIEQARMLRCWGVDAAGTVNVSSSDCVLTKLSHGRITDGTLSQPKCY